MNEDRALPVKAHIPLLILSLVLSLMLWAVVTTQEVTKERDLWINLGYTNLRKGILALDRPPPGMFLHVNGPTDAVRQLIDGKDTGTVDLTHAAPGKGTFTVALPTDLRDLVADGFGHVDLTVDKLVPGSPMIVETGTLGRLSDPNLVLGPMDVDPHTVVVTGPKSSLQRVAKARVSVDLSKVHPDDSLPYEGYIQLYDSRSNQLNLEDLNLQLDRPTAQVHLRFIGASVQKSVNVFVPMVGHPNSGFRLDGDYIVTPSFVAVTGPSMTVAKTSQVSTEPVDLTGLTANHQFVVNVIPPPGVTAVTPRVVKVRVAIRAVPRL